MINNSENYTEIFCSVLIDMVMMSSHILVPKPLEGVLDSGFFTGAVKTGEANN